MINRDYKGFNRSKPLFSRKKSRRKGAIVTISALSVVFAAVSYLAMTPGEESSTQEKQQEILTLQLSTDDNNSSANSANLDTESNSLPLTDGVLEQNHKLVEGFNLALQLDAVHQEDGNRNAFLA